MTHRCSWCDQEKPLDEFLPIDHDGQTGYVLVCPECRSDYAEFILGLLEFIVECIKRGKAKRDPNSLYCSHCKKILPVDQFYKPYLCRTCDAAYRRSHRKKLKSGEATKRPIISVNIRDGFKYCNKCKQIKPVGDFPRSSKYANGYHSYCKSCNNERNRQRYHATKKPTKAPITISDSPVLSHRTKVCPMCDERKPISNFLSTNNHCYPYCRSCNRKYKRDRYHKNKQHINELRRLGREKRKENK